MINCQAIPASFCSATFHSTPPGRGLFLMDVGFEEGYFGDVGVVDGEL